VSPKPTLTASKPPLLLTIVALCTCLAATVRGDFADHSFEQKGQTGPVLQRPDGNLWAGYQLFQDEHDVTNAFDVPKLFKTAILNSNGDHVAGSDRLLYTGNRFAQEFFGGAMAVQPDNKLLVSIETGEFLRLNPDGTLDPTFNPPVSHNSYHAMVVQADGKILVAPTLDRFNADGSKDPSFTSPLVTEGPNRLALQSSGKAIANTVSSPYLRRLNTDGSVDSTFVANLSTRVDSILILPNDAILLRLAQLTPGGTLVFTIVRLNPDGSSDPSFHPDSRLYIWHAVQSDGKVVASFRDPSTGNFFLGRMNVDGSLDSSYQTYSLEPSGYIPPVLVAFVQSDGSILAEIDSSNEGQQFFRFSSSGVLNPASKTPFKIPGPVTQLSGQWDGKFLALGDFNFVDDAKAGSLVRLDNNGNLDAGFHPLMFAFPTTGLDLDLQSGGSILVSVISANTPDYSELRLTPDGSVDSSFASQNLGALFKVQSDDKIVTAHFDNVVRRLLSDGNVDPAFSQTSVSFSGNQGDIIAGFAIQTDGKIIVAGNGKSFAGIHSEPVKAGVVRLNPDGGIDGSFNPPAFNDGTRFNCVATQPDGKILLGGRFSSSDGSGIANLIRLNSDGSVDHAFVAVPDYTVSAILVEDSGTILIGGGFSNVNGQPAARVARLEPNGQLDSSFTLDTRGGAVYALTALANGSVVAGGEFGLVASPALPASRLRNISSRMFVGTGDNALIGGIIITGSGEKKLLLRGIGPSLTGAGVNGALDDPNLELRNSNGALIASNDDWQNSADKQAISDTTLAPTNPREAAILASVPAGGATYTAIVRPARGTPGIGLVEVYDLDADSSSSRLANLSARGNVLTGDQALIGGFIVAGPTLAAPTGVLVRALGPSIPLTGVLQDPTLELHRGGATLGANDDWKQAQQYLIEQTTLSPKDDRESALLRLATPGAYTAIIRGKDSSTGIGLLEIYDVTR
jgi:uncharacterized delta-60 repeat protein